MAVLLWPGDLRGADLKWSGEQIEKKVSWKDTEVRFRFPFTNVSKRTVMLLDAATSCGCAEVDRKALRAYGPGEKGVLEAVYRIGNRTGRRLETLYLQTDDPGKKVVELRIMVVIPELVVFRPGLAVWNVEESPAAKSMVARWEGPGRGELRKISTEDPSWKVSFAMGDLPNEWLITVTPGSTSVERIEKIRLDFTNSDTGPRTVLGYGVVQKFP